MTSIGNLATSYIIEISYVYNSAREEIYILLRGSGSALFMPSKYLSSSSSVSSVSVSLFRSAAYSARYECVARWLSRATARCKFFDPAA